MNPLPYASGDQHASVSQLVPYGNRTWNPFQDEERSYVNGKFYLQCELGSENELKTSDLDMMGPSQDQGASFPASTIQSGPTFAPSVTGAPQASGPQLRSIAPAQPIAPVRPRKRRTY